MPLFDLEGNPQPLTGTRAHWRQFEDFQRSPLHKEFERRITPHLSEEQLDSSRLGSDILSKIEADSPNLLEEYQFEDVGSLFGMTLWNILAQHSESWRFFRAPREPGEIRGMIYDRRQEE